MPVNIIPKFYNSTIGGCNGMEDEIQVSIGSRVKSGDDIGIVKYIGEVQGYNGIWYGVEWDDVARGKHDGFVDNIQYFKTTKPNAGSFVRPNKITPLRTCADAIRKYYGDREVCFLYYVLSLLHICPYKVLHPHNIKCSNRHMFTILHINLFLFN